MVDLGSGDGLAAKLFYLGVGMHCRRVSALRSTRSGEHVDTCSKNILLLKEVGKR